MYAAKFDKAIRFISLYIYNFRGTIVKQLYFNSDFPLKYAN